MDHASRRHFLTGLTLGAGATALTPVLRSLEAQAAGRPAPHRVVFVVESNGLYPHHVQPAGVDRPRGGADRLIDRSLDGLELNAAIDPLAPYKDRLTLIQGLSGRIAEGGSGGHSTSCGGLGCYPGSRGAFAQTVDSALGDALPAPVAHVALGIVKSPEAATHHGLSASGPGRPVPIQCRPDLAFRSLFGLATDPAERQTFDLKTDLLDFMADDVKRVRGRLAGPEREKLDRYAEAFEALRDRQVRVSGVRDALARHAPAADKFTSRAETDRLEGHFDLAAAALVAGLTNVVTLSSGGGHQNYISYDGLGLPIDGHGIGHGQGVAGKTPDECRVVIRRFHCRLIARLADKLRAVPEGDGTVLDNTLIVYLSDSGEAHHPNLHEWPVVLLGDLGGRLKAGNRLIEYSRYGRNGHKTTANLYLSLLHAAGRRAERFGLPDPKLADLDTAGPLGELAP